MIQTKLKIEEYCEACSSFQAEHNQNNLYADNGTALIEVIVSCRYKDHCAHLIRHLKGVADNDNV